MIARVLTFFALACCAAPALSHAFPEHAEPGAGATLRVSPSRVALSFSEKLEPVFSSVTVTDSSGHSVAAGATVFGGNSMVLPLRSLGPGRYRVAWHVVSVDTHRTEGAYSFTVKP
ncbi:MAG TPA: copper resistance CopC family protein [Bryobacteraceae bacterium]